MMARFSFPIVFNNVDQLNSFQNDAWKMANSMLCSPQKYIIKVLFIYFFRHKNTRIALKLYSFL